MKISDKFRIPQVQDMARELMKKKCGIVQIGDKISLNGKKFIAAHMPYAKVLARVCAEKKMTVDDAVEQGVLDG